jgi:hypothetical protein
MATIISNSELQKNPGKLAKIVGEKGVILTTHGVPKMMVVPYYEDSDLWLEDYLENYEIWKNQKMLKQEMSDSKASGISDLII